jgi:small-conductance mechanosensitive channel
VSNFLIISGAVGIAATLMGLVGLGVALARENQWGMALVCLAAMGLIVFLTLLGIELADQAWKEI